MSRIRAVANTLLSARSFNCWRGIMASCFGILLAALSVHSLSAQAGRLESLCNSTDRDLMELGPLDDLTSDVMAVVRSKIAGDVRDYLRTLPAEEARAARTRIRRVTYAQIDSLPASLVGVAKKALAPALAEVFSHAAMGDAQRRLDVIEGRLQQVQIPQEPELPKGELPSQTCRQAIFTSGSLKNYISSWMFWKSDLSAIAALPPYESATCAALSPKKYAKMASDLTRLEVPIMQMGLMIDSVSGGGSGHGADFFGRVRSLSDTALAIESKLSTLARRAKTLHDQALPRFRNFEANYINIVAPATAAVCQREQLAALRAALRQSTNQVRAASPPRPSARTVEIVKYVMTERGYLRRVESSQNWQETFSNNPRVFNFVQQEINNGTLVLYDASRGYTFRVPLRRNECVELSRGGKVEAACYYRVQDVNMMRVQQ